MKNLLIAIVMLCTLLVLAAFSVFCAFRYMDRKEDKPERIFFIVLGVITLFIAVTVFVGITSI